MPASPPRFSRRAALRLLGVGLLATVAGCRPSKKSDAAATPTSGLASSSPPNVAPAQALAARAADDERALLAAYDAAIAAQPDLEPTLAPLRADHAAHLVGLVPGAPTTPAGPADPAAGTSATPTPAPSSPSFATGEGTPAGSSAGSPAQSPRALALAALAAKERAAAAARVDDAMSAQGSLARLLASIGGCEASHASLLAVAS